MIGVPTSVPSATAMSADFRLGPVDQIAFVVDDLDAVLPAFEAMFGAMTTRRIDVEAHCATVRGKPMASRLYVAFGRSGDLQIEVIQVEAGEAAATEHLLRHGPGLHHVRFKVEDLSRKRDELLHAGFQVIGEGETAGVRFCYLEAPERYGHTAFEIVQFPNEGSTTTA